MTFFDFVYLLGNGLMVFTIMQFMHIFFDQSKVSPPMEALAYGLYFLVTSSIYILTPIPLWILCSNLVLLFLYTQLYMGTVKKALLVTLTIYSSLACIETIFAFLSSLKEINPLLPFAYQSILGLIMARILSYAFVLTLKGMNHAKSQPSLPVSYWISLLIVPTCSLCMLIAVLIANTTTNALVMVSVVGVFAINVLTFTLYDKVSLLLHKQMDHRLLEEQTRYHEKQLDMMKHALEQMRILRHDLSNKLSPLLSLSQEHDMEKVQTFLREILQYTSPNQSMVNSGNQDIDSILNYKLEKARQEGVSITTEILVPNTLNIPSSDLAVILGNLTDNALEAVQTEVSPWIHIKMNYGKGLLVVEIANAFDGVVVKKQNQLLTRKKEKKEHGLGLHSVEMILEKYDGIMQLSYDETTFQTKLLLYI